MSANSKKRGQCEKNILLLKHWPVVPEIRKLNVYLAERCPLSKVKNMKAGMKRRNGRMFKKALKGNFGPEKKL